MVSDQESDNPNVESKSNCTSDSDEESVLNEEASVRVFQENKPYPAFTTRMRNICKEFLLCSLFAITYAILTNDPPKVIKFAPAVPFFRENSVVKDWYGGEISKAIDDARSSDIAFVMFYAPWSAECQHARAEFEKAAQAMHRQVNFAAVNCWQPMSECKTQYSKVYNWPVLIAYPAHGKGIQYTGAIVAEHMVKFLHGICHPLIRAVPGETIKVHDVHVTAYLNALPGSMDFAIYYTTAIRFLKMDPLKTINFYIVPQNISEPILKMHVWNSTLNYPMEKNEWNPDAISTWILTYLSQVSSWITPTGSKSLGLSHVVSKRPTLIMFTPRNPLHQSNDYYDMLHLIARDYYDCDDFYIADELENLRNQRKLNVKQHKTLKSKCFDMLNDIERKKLKVKTKKWINSSADNNKCGTNSLTTENEECDSNMHFIESNGDSSADCIKKIINSNLEYETSMVLEDYDMKSPRNLLKSYELEKCRQFLFGEDYLERKFEDNENASNSNVSVHGLSCKVNKSLSFIAMDSILHYHFAEKLGIDLSLIPDRSAVSIVNDEMESHYIMEGPVTSANIKTFINNYTNYEISRAHNSTTTITLRNTHSYLKETKQCREGSSSLCIEELNSATFLSTISQLNKAVLVFYYSKQCSFCSGVSYSFMRAARKLSYIQNIRFTRIDGDLNILPWEYIMEYYPTILYFPPNRKSESRVFPRNMPITVSNLLGFILSNLDPTLKVQAIWSICQHITNDEEHLSCLTTLRIETLSLIEATLQQWRRANNRQKQMILYRLKQLKHLYLLISHKPKNYKEIILYFNRVHDKKQLSNNYHSITKTVKKFKITKEEL